jgi:hypothetical protein
LRYLKGRPQALAARKPDADTEREKLAAANRGLLFSPLFRRCYPAVFVAVIPLLPAPRGSEN